MATRQRVRCVICGKVTAGVVPRGGTGDYMRPRRHDGDGEGGICDGSYTEAEWVTDEAGPDYGDLGKPRTRRTHGGNG